MVEIEVILIEVNEAIGRIKEHIEVHYDKEPRAIYVSEALYMGIDALKKQMPQKPNGDRCPKCGSDSISVWLDGGFRETQFDFCPNCGQALDWSEE